MDATDVEKNDIDMLSSGEVSNIDFWSYDRDREEIHCGDMQQAVRDYIDHVHADNARGGCGYMKRFNLYGFKIKPIKASKSQLECLTERVIEVMDEWLYDNDYSHEEASTCFDTVEEVKHYVEEILECASSKRLHIKGKVEITILNYEPLKYSFQTA